MNKKELQKFIGNENLTLAEAMQKIDRNACGILFVLDANERISGCITDGDIRRFLLAGGDISAPIVLAANKHPKIAYTRDEARSIYHEKDYVAVPIVNETGILVDVYVGSDKYSDRKYDSLCIPVVINAGGKGTRLDPFTRVLPKPLVPVGDLPIIEHIMKEYRSYECNRFHIIVNYKRDLMKAYFADNDSEYDITWYDEEKPLGTGGGIRLLKGKIHETFFFANCDALLTADYADILEFHKKNKNKITMVCAYKNMDIPYGVVEMGENGIILDMKEKPVMSFLTNTGIYIVEPEVIDDMEDNVSIGFPDVMKQQQKKGKRIAVFPVGENDWMDMGQLPELEKMRIKLYGE